MRGTTRRCRGLLPVGLSALSMLLLSVPATAVPSQATSGARARALAPSGRMQLAAPTSTLLPSRNPSAIVPRFVNRTGSQSLGGWVAVYGGHDRTDPTVSVTLASNSDEYVSLPRATSHATTVGGRPARMGMLHGRWILSWSAFDTIEDSVQAALIARNMTAHEAAALARRTQVDRRLMRIGLDHPPTGLRQLADGPLSLPDLENCVVTPGAVTSVRWGALTDFYGAGSPWICLRQWRANAALDAVLQTALAGPDELVRGQAGVAGNLAFLGYLGKGDIAARTWREGGTTVLVTSDGESQTDIDSFVASLRPAAVANWRRTTHEATIPPPPEHTSTVRSLTGGFDTGWWRYAITRRPIAGRVFLDDESLLFEVDGSGGFSGGGSFAPILTVGVEWDHTDGTLIHAIVERAASRLVLTFPSGRRASVALTDFGSAFGEKAYALRYRGAVDVVAADSYAADGRRLAHASGRPFPHGLGGGYSFGGVRSG